MFSPCYFHVIISIGILESNSLSLSTPSVSYFVLLQDVNYIELVYKNWYGCFGTYKVLDVPTIVLPHCNECTSRLYRYDVYC